MWHRKSTRMIRVAVFAVFLVACMPASAKCPLIFIDFSGEIVGSSPGSEDRISVDVQPKPNTVDQSIVSEGRRFHVRIPFDTTKSGGRFHHNCTRRPVEVVVALWSNDQEVSRVTLLIDEDFEESDEGDFSGRSSVRLVKP